VSRRGEILLLTLVLAILGAGVAAVNLMNQSPQPPGPILVPSPNPSATAPAATPMQIEVTSSALPGDQTYMGVRWESRQVTIDNQVGAWFTPILQTAVDRWNASGSPVTLSVTFGGAPACDSPPAATVVVCLHTFSGADADDDGLTILQATSVASASTVNGMAIAAASSGMVWLRANQRGHSFPTVTLHELGHVEGLGESSCVCSIMFVRVRNGSSITSADVALLQALYAGPPADPAPPPSSPSSATPTTSSCRLSLLGWCLIG